jgi:hypothetical protein
MANRNPVHARVAKRRAHRPGTLAELLAILWGALLEAQTILEGTPEGEAELKLKCIHAISQRGGQCEKLLEIDELESRLVEIEMLVKGCAA